MTETCTAGPVAAIAPGLSEGRRRVIELEDAIAKIRTQIATADMARQRGHKAIDPDWFHRARTALRHLNRERAQLLAQGSGSRRRETLKDTLITVLRERHDEETWNDIVAEAKARSEGEGV